MMGMFGNGNGNACSIGLDKRALETRFSLPLYALRLSVTLQRAIANGVNIMRLMCLASYSNILSNPSFPHSAVLEAPA
jgi:hypothetical protein